MNKYAVEVEMLSGIKKGMVQFVETNDELKGSFEILGSNHPFKQVKQEGDTYLVNGSIETEEGPIHYEIEARKVAKTIHAIIKTNKGHFQMSGNEI